MSQRIWSGVLLSTCLLVLALTLPAEALTLQSVDGDWGDVVGGKSVIFRDDIGVNYGNGQEDQVRWGEPANRYQSGLGFTGVASGTTFDVGDIFEIGQLRHFNNPIMVGSAAETAQLTLNLTFSDPTGIAEMFDFTFAIDETPNSPGPPLSDDLIDFPDVSLLRSFSVGSFDYTFELLGFGESGDNLIDYFRSPEGTTNATMLWGKIESVPSTVPEPTTLLLLVSGLLGLIGFRKKLRTQ